MKKSIRTFNKIAQKGLSLFDPSQFSVSDSEENPSAIVLRSHNLHELSFNSDLQCIGRAGAGVNNIPVEACTEKGVVVFNAPGANANAVKELVFTGMLLSSRDVVGGINFAKTVQDNGTAFSKQIESNKSRFAGEEIKGKTLGVIGLGAIGLLVANSAVHLGLKVQGYDPFLSVNRAWELSNAVKPAKSLEKLLAESDFISIHVPYSEKTKQFFDDKRLSLFKKGSVLLNFSREGLVDHDAVTEALDKGMLSKYVTDFPSSSLVQHDNVIAIPHLGASTLEAEENCAVMIANQVKAFLDDGNITNSVNFPDCSLDRLSRTRLTITNKNVPTIISQVTSILADNNVNIIEMMNKSRGDIAYSIIDIEGTISDTVVGSINTIDGVMATRHIR